MTRNSATAHGSTANAGSSSCTDVLIRLSHLDPSTLAQILLQHGSSIGTAVRLTLTTLAHAELLRSSVSDVENVELKEEDEEGAEKMLEVLSIVLSRALGRGDPSLARVILPGTPSLIDLSISLGTLTPQSPTATKLRASLRSLIDPHLASEILQAVHASLQTAILGPFDAQQLLSVSRAGEEEAILVDVQRRARMLTLLLRALPVSRGADDPYGVVLRQLAGDLGRLHDGVVPALSSQRGSAVYQAAQVHLRDAALALVLLCPPTAGHSAVADLISSLGSAASKLKTSDEHLSLVGVLRARFLGNSEVGWDELMVALKKNASTSSGSSGIDEPEQLMQVLQQRKSSSRPVRRTSAKKGKSRATTRGTSSSSAVDPEILATVRSILPHLDTPTLARRLQRPKYASATTSEQIIDLLLESTSDADDDDDDDEDEEEEDAQDLLTRPYEPPPPIVRTRRANIFDDDPLDLSKFRYKPDVPQLDTSTNDNNSSKSDGLYSIPSDLKASVLARVAAQEREEEEEEWELDGGGVREAGFEEELEGEEGDEHYTARNGGGMDWVGRRGMTTSLAQSSGPGGRGMTVTAVPSAREWRRKIEDESDEDEDDEDTNAAGGPSTAGMVKPPPPPPSSTQGGSSSSAAGERVAEQILTRYYSQYGASLFARDPVLRKGNNALGKVRAQLIGELGRESGKSWDHGLVESWGVMFERNPRKDKLLARSTDLLAPNPNHAPSGGAGQEGGAGGEEEGGRRFGPDRGRGGRVLRGGGSSRGRGSSSAAGEASTNNNNTTSSSGGRGGGAGAGRGQHSGSNRAAKQKEKRGSSARFRGGRGGGMARSGAFPAGVGE
ncbi:hypothetical protein A4X09_0g5014 [Tilletia walkeri]|uniref:CUE domain-containing protein n=1 Tax=Tilletia walkeri TaxID=117179 RepID=A0A8X7T3B5_9BASI|nr:hypothetical protein A4X09_0g5014 [Tilletia walkeri]